MDNILSKKLFQKFKEPTLFGRYITSISVTPLLNNLPENVILEKIGKSVKGESIHVLTLGTGPNKIMMWSQMHGNESTTTKALFDLINTLLKSKTDIINEVLNKCKLFIVPMLNPDGALAYTRFNSNEVDLNRDAVDLSQPESRALRALFDAVKPDFCFNLHDQRTIFSAGAGSNPASVSFLAPTQDKEKSITPNREKAMKLIVKMNNSLQKVIPNGVGRYDDSFNINCVGDMFQNKGASTILFEAGHFENDYQREFTRYLIYHSLLVSLTSIVTESYMEICSKDYEAIPQNEELFYDVIIRNAKTIKDGVEAIFDIGIQYEEKLKEGTIIFQPKIEKILKQNEFYAHREINANGYRVFDAINKDIHLGYANDFVLINNEKYSLKLENI